MLALENYPDSGGDGHIGKINETPGPHRLAIYDKLYAKILAGLKE